MAIRATYTPPPPPPTPEGTITLTMPFSAASSVQAACRDQTGAAYVSEHRRHCRDVVEALDAALKEAIKESRR